VFGLGPVASDLSFLAPPTSGTQLMKAVNFEYHSVKDPDGYVGLMTSVVGKICAKERAARIKAAFSGTLSAGGDAGAADEADANPTLPTGAAAGIAAGGMAFVCLLLLCAVVSVMTAVGGRISYCCRRPAASCCCEAANASYC